jgi:hypothetical protein
MIDPKSNSIVIVRPGDKPHLLDDEMLQHYVEESEPETSTRARMLAVVLLAGIVAAVFGVGGVIMHLLQRWH